MNLSLNAYTQWYWKADLHNLMHFLSLRADAHAQYEIRVYADAMLDTREGLGARSATTPSRTTAWAPSPSPPQMLAVVRRLPPASRPAAGGSGLSKREWRELMETLGRPVA